MTDWHGIAADLRDRTAKRLPNRAILGGALVTAVSTHVLFTYPPLIDFPAFRGWLFDLSGFYFLENPFPPLRFLGGLVGGYVTGYLTRHYWYTAMVNGIQAVVLGMGVFYAGLVVGDLVRFLLGGALTGSTAMVVVLQPLIFVLVPFSLVYFFQSLVTSPVGNVVANALHDGNPGPAPADGVERVPAAPRWLVRGAVATGVLAVLFGVVWWFVFFSQARY